MPIELGLKGVELQPGQHLCGLYAGVRQRNEILLPFLRAGLESGDKCICIIDGTEPMEIVAALGPLGAESTPAGTKRLDVMRADDVNLRSGKFSAEETIATWKAAISAVMYQGQFCCVRAVETWSHRYVVPDTRELLRLESEMRHFLPLYPQMMLCLYDLERFGAELVSSVIKLHPKVLVSGMVVENPFYLTPDEITLTLDDVLAASYSRTKDGSSNASG
jgi:MEDS: MEthanogen/methylotroph, DcmR Sensory domain